MNNDVKNFRVFSYQVNRIISFDYEKKFCTIKTNSKMSF